MSGIIPNSTQVPNIVLDEIMPTLKDVELRVLLVIIRQTLGWIEDLETGRRKEKDWINQFQLRVLTGRGTRAISSAVDKLCKSGLIVVYNRNNEQIFTASERRLNFGKVFYRFNHKYGENMLIKPVGGRKLRAQNLRTQKMRTTKETYIQKNNNKYIKNSERQKNRERLKAMKSVMFNKS